MSQESDARRERIWAILDALKDTTLAAGLRESLESELERLGQVFDPAYRSAPDVQAFAERLDWLEVTDFDKLYQRKAELDRRFFGGDPPEES